MQYFILLFYLNFIQPWYSGKSNLILLNSNDGISPMIWLNSLSLFGFPVIKDIVLFIFFNSNKYLNLLFEFCIIIIIISNKIKSYIMLLK
jgi:hypothetical protein